MQQALLLDVPGGGEPLDDLLGENYCVENEPQSRRAHGITLTPIWLVEHMLDLLGEQSFDTVVDCGAGTGRFAIAAAKRFPRARIVAVEAHPEMAILLRQRLWETGLSQRVEVVEGDLRSERIRRQGRTLFLGNPPYVRHHDISPEWKAWYERGMAARGIRASQLAGLHAHFMLHAVEQMSAGDHMCFVTSAEWLDNGYGRALRELCFSDGVALQSMWVTEPGELVFPDALVSAAVFELSCRQPADRIRAGSIAGQQFNHLRDVEPASLRAAPRWSIWARRELDVQGNGVELGELFRVTRGQVTGQNEFWVLPPDQQVLPKSLTTRAVTRAAEIIAGDVLSKNGVRQLKVVADLPADLDALGAEDARLAKRFIQLAKKMDAHQSYIARHRKPWWAVGMREPPAAFVSYMGRRPPVFRSNPHGVSFLNIAHGLYPRQPMSQAQLDSILLHLNQSTSINSGRIYGGGLAKFEPSDIAGLRIPDEVFEGGS